MPYDDDDALGLEPMIFLDDDEDEDEDDPADTWHAPMVVPVQGGLAPGVKKMNDGIVLTERLTSFANRLRRALPLSVVKELTINSGVRTVEGQARAMIKKLESGNTDEFLRMYKSAGKQLMELPERSVKAWTPYIKQFYDQGVMNKEGHIAGGSLDIGIVGWPKAAVDKLDEAAKALGALKTIRESAPSAHLHIDIPLTGQANRFSGEEPSESASLLYALVGRSGMLPLGLDPFLPTRAPAARYQHVNTIANALVDQRADAYGSEEEPGRPKSPAGRLVWDAAARLYQRMKAEGIQVTRRMKCGTELASAIETDPQAGLASVWVFTKDAKRVEAMAAAVAKASIPALRVVVSGPWASSMKIGFSR